MSSLSWLEAQLKQTFPDLGGVPEQAEETKHRDPTSDPEIPLRDPGEEEKDTGGEGHQPRQNDQEPEAPLRPGPHVLAKEKSPQKPEDQVVGQAEGTESADNC